MAIEERSNSSLPKVRQMKVYIPAQSACLSNHILLPVPKLDRQTGKGNPLQLHLAIAGHWLRVHTHWDNKAPAQKWDCIFQHRDEKIC